MRTIKGPAIFLAQFAGDAPPFNTLRSIGKWAAGLGFKGVQIPTWESRLFDLERAAQSKTYCDEIKGVLAEEGLQITELSTHLQGQLVAVHPAYDEAFDGFAPAQLRRNPQARQKWAVEQVLKAARASQNLGLEGARDVLRRARLALSVSVAAAPRRPDRDRVRRARAPLAADPRRVRRRRRRRVLRDPPRRRPVRRRDVRALPRPRRRSSPLQHAVRPESLRAAAARLSRLHRRLSLAHQDLSRQGRRVQSDGEARRLLAAISRGSIAPAASARSATARSTSTASSRS